MNTRFSRQSIITILIVCLSAIPGFTRATPLIRSGGENAIKVTFADLDLTRVEGVQVLYERLKKAADRVCDRKVGLREVIDVMDFKHSCVKSALADAVKSIDNDLLNRMHRASGNS